MKTIMVVDDSPTIRKILSFMLRKQDYIIAEAEDGIDAMEKLSHVQADLILVDLNMPNMDGIEFAKNLRSNYYYMDTPIIMLTTTRDEDLKKNAFDAGINLFLNKPIQPNILLYKVESLLRGGE
jgi:two-component system, chemotaxis family, chemotaxis protein CheY